MDIQEQLSRMSLKEKIGQMFVVSIPGISLEESTLELLEEYCFGSVYLYNLNYVNPTMLREYCESLKKNITRITGIPPLLSGTYEGGEMIRFGLYNFSIPCSVFFGTNKNQALPYFAGKLLGAQLYDLGLNFNWAPVLDVPSISGGSQLRKRCYSSDPDIVAEIGREMIRGMHKSGIGCAAKHFPGLGAFSLLTHKGHFIGIRDGNQFYEEHVFPFKKSIDAGIDTIVLGNFIESNHQYGYRVGNYNCLCDYLRNEMGYDGVISTDAIQNMEGIPALSVEAIANSAIASDVDLLVFGYDTRRQMQIYDQILYQVENGLVPESRINRSVERILRLKQRMNQYDQAAERMKEHDKTIYLRELCRSALEIRGSSASLGLAKKLVRGVVYNYMPYYREKDFSGFERTLDCCLTDILCKYAGEVHSTFYDDTGFESQISIIGENNLITIVCESFNQSYGIDQFVSEIAKKNLVICYVLTQNSEDIRFASENVIFVFLHSLSDISVIEATKILFGDDDGIHRDDDFFHLFEE